MMLGWSVYTALAFSSNYISGAPIFKPFMSINGYLSSKM